MQPILPEFKSAIEALWHSLGLPAPRFTEPGRIQLRVESISLDLIDNGRGTLVIEGIAGTVSSEQAARSAQIRKILQTNLGFLLDSEAAVYAKTDKNQHFSLAVQASCAFRNLSTATLIQKIEDVIRTIEYYSAELKTGYSGAKQLISNIEMMEPAVIFRP